MEGILSGALRLYMMYCGIVILFFLFGVLAQPATALATAQQMGLAFLLCVLISYVTEIAKRISK